MTQQENSSLVVTASLVPSRSRLKALPRHFGRFMISVEHSIYDAMGEYCPAYNGGAWSFHDLSNGGFFMAPTGVEKYSLSCAGNYFAGELSAEASGIVASLVGINRVLWKYPQENGLLRHFYALREFALEHAEAELILAAID
jgi:Antirestriction protein